MMLTIFARCCQLLGTRLRPCSQGHSFEWVLNTAKAAGRNSLRCLTRR